MMLSGGPLFLYICIHWCRGTGGGVGLGLLGIFLLFPKQYTPIYVIVYWRCHAYYLDFCANVALLHYPVLFFFNYFFAIILILGLSHLHWDRARLTREISSCNLYMVFFSSVSLSRIQGRTQHFGGLPGGSTTSSRPMPLFHRSLSPRMYPSSNNSASSSCSIALCLHKNLRRWDLQLAYLVPFGFVCNMNGSHDVSSLHCHFYFVSYFFVSSHSIYPPHLLFFHYHLSFHGLYARFTVCFRTTIKLIFM